MINRGWKMLDAAGALSAGLSIAAGCAPPPRTDAAGSDTQGEASFLTVAPAGALCIRVTATPSSGSAVVQTFSTTSGASTANFSLGTLAPGSYTFTADAFGVACASIGSNQPIDKADPVAATIRAGVVTALAFTFRPLDVVSASANFVPNVVGLAGGGFESFALTDTGLDAWGELGSTVPVAVVGLSAVSAAASGNSHACAIRASDQTVWCWGSNSFGQIGPAVAMGGFSSTPVQVALPGIKASLIAAGTNHTCAYSSSTFTVYCRGFNGDGELGNNSTVNSSTPVVALANTPIRTLSATQSFTIAAGGDGTHLGWGSNANGQIGDSNLANHLVPVAVTDPTVQMVAAGGFHACSLHDDGSVWCWGRNDSGQLGDGTSLSRTTAAQVSLPVAAKVVTTGLQHTCALLFDGRVACWGYNFDGEIGDLTSTDRLNPTFVGLGGDTGQKLATGGDHNCVYTTTSLSVLCWGMNAFGQIGDGTLDAAFGPTKVAF